MINLEGLQVRSVNPGAVFPKNNQWRFTVMVNGIAWEDPILYERAAAAKQDMRAEVERLRLKHCLMAPA